MPHVRAIIDDRGRIMVLMTHNTDFGDSYEREGENPQYFEVLGARLRVRHQRLRLCDDPLAVRPARAAVHRVDVGVDRPTSSALAIVTTRLSAG